MIRAAAAAVAILALTNTETIAGVCPLESTWRVSIADLPGLADIGGKGGLVRFIEQVAEFADVDVVYDVVPFARSMINVESGRADMHIPLLHDSNTPFVNAKLMYSDAVLFNVPFQFYVAAGSALTLAQLTDGTRTIETDSAHIDFFPFSVDGSSCIECSLNKVRLGRIDAFIYAEPPTDEAIVLAGLEGAFERHLYENYPVRAVLPRNACGRSINQKLLPAVVKARKQSGHPLFRLSKGSADSDVR